MYTVDYNIQYILINIRAYVGHV